MVGLALSFSREPMAMGKKGGSGGGRLRRASQTRVGNVGRFDVC